MSRMVILAVMASVALSGVDAMARSFQSVARIGCPGGDFVVDARPWGENEAGSSRVALRYRFRGVELAAIHYEAHFKNLTPWLRRDDPPIFNLGLNLDTSGASKTSDYDRGDTLYLPPSQFSRADVESLLDCLGENAEAVRRDFERAEIRSSAFLGLMATRSGTGRNGVARLVHADTPITGIYGSGWLLILFERGGRVLLHTNLTANNAAEFAVWGEVVRASGRRPTLRLERSIRFNGETHDASNFLPETETTTGRRLRDDFNVEWR